MRLVDKLYFYNQYHIGDVIMSKPFVREISKQIDHNVLYFAHNYSARLVNDVAISAPIQQFPFLRDDMFTHWENNNLFINMWAAKTPSAVPSLSGAVYVNMPDRSRCNFETFALLFNDLIKFHLDENMSLQHMLDNPNEYIWDLKVENSESITDIVPNLQNNNTKVLIYNQTTYSGQSDNQSFGRYIRDISIQFPHIQFYTSQGEDISRDNVCCLGSTFKNKNPQLSCDLPELAVVSKYCDVICGPGNGPLQYTWCKGNIDNPNKTYITINNAIAGQAQWSTTQLCSNTVVSTTAELFLKLEEILQK
jgi:hypothetical protein